MMSKYRYYRVMDMPYEDWGAYRLRSSGQKGQAPFKDSRGILHLHSGDYLLQAEDGSLSAMRPAPDNYNAFKGVLFDSIPELSKLEAEGIIVEIPLNIAARDFYLQLEMEKTMREIRNTQAELYLLKRSKEMEQRKFGFLTKGAKEARKNYDESTAKIKELERKYEELADQQDKEIILPLSQKDVSLSSVILSASARSSEARSAVDVIERDTAMR